jgi:hypothetical protein
VRRRLSQNRSSCGHRTFNTYSTQTSRRRCLVFTSPPTSSWMELTPILSFLKQPKPSLPSSEDLKMYSLSLSLFTFGDLSLLIISFLCVSNPHFNRILHWCIYFTETEKASYSRISCLSPSSSSFFLGIYITTSRTCFSCIKSSYCKLSSLIVILSECF